MSDLNYKKAGVDVKANELWTGKIAKKVSDDRKQHGITHVGAIGGFAGALKLPEAIVDKITAFAISKVENYQMPIGLALRHALSSFSLVACTDGIGTKTMIAEQLGKLETLGYDVLAMNANDMVAGGATPIAFLDYIGCHHIEIDGKFCYEPFIDGLIKACREIDVELIGGETSEMSNNYTEFGSDLTGFALGIVTDDDIPKKETIRKGDVLLGLKSSGVHSNGYSLIRRLINERNLSYDDKPIELNGKTIGEVLLTPTRLYVNQALAANATGKVKGMAHITGGGLKENIERSLPKGMTAVIDEGKLCQLDVFEWLANQDEIDYQDMLKTFNMGFGFVFVASQSYIATIRKAVDEELTVIGFVE